MGKKRRCRAQDGGRYACFTGDDGTKFPCILGGIRGFFDFGADRLLFWLSSEKVLDRISWDGVRICGRFSD